MESYGSDYWPTETYMIPVTGSHLNMPSTPALPKVDAMGSKVMPEYITDQNYYSPSAAAPNYYGYFYTGFESPGEWDGHYKIFGVDGQDLHYPGLQTEGLQYVYYTPSGYAQSPYNPYNPYIPGAAVVSDSPFIGTPTQQSIASPNYQQPLLSPGYFPVILQPGTESVPVVSTDPSLINRSGPSANVHESSVYKYTLPSTSIVALTSCQIETPPAATVPNHLPKLTEGSQAYSVKKATSHGILTSASNQQGSHGRNFPSSLQTADQFLRGTAASHQPPLRVTIPHHNGIVEHGSSHGWATVDAFKPALHVTGLLKNGNATTDMLGEKNRGPRTSRTKTQWTPSMVVKAYTSKAGEIDPQGNLTINADQYNRQDFPVSYSSAKFFVIKSYSEDDVHKSIKYNVWSSTPNGNKRLDAAYEDAQKLSGGNWSNCPIFLFFSVNASGQFCGVAEMIGPVDFHKDMDFWQQDKWSGSFPVKWHIIKDVPNTSFRHIILENNENKPVTNSRDTQEILFIPGLNMLSIFKDSPLWTSILDDFMYYEDRQRIMYGEKLRQLTRKYERSTIFVPASVLPIKQTVTIKEPQKVSENTSKPENVEESDNEVVGDGEVGPEPARGPAVNGTRDGEPAPALSDEDVSPVMKIGCLSIDTKVDDNNPSTAAVASISSVDVVTVGSMPIKVNGFISPSPDTVTVGTIPIDTRGVEHSSAPNSRA